MVNGIDHHGGNEAPAKPKADKPEAKAVATAKPADPKIKGGEKSK